MSFKNYSILVLIPILLHSCNSRISEEASINENEIFYVDIDNVTASIDLKLSDLVDSVRLVPIETSKESLIGGGQWFVCDEWILLIGDGVYKFSPEGKYISKPLLKGRGPMEIPRITNYNISDKYGILIIDLAPNNSRNLLAYKFKGKDSVYPVPKAIEGSWRSLGIVNDSVFIGNQSPQVQEDSLKITLFYQNYQGEIIDSVPNKRKAYSIYPAGITGEVFQNAWIRQGEEFNYVSFESENDTLFKLIDGDLLPYLILIQDPPIEYPPEIGPWEEGDRDLGFPRFENPSYSIISEGIVDEIIAVSTTAYRMESHGYYYFLNKSTKKTYRINSYEDDLIGTIREADGESLNLPNAQANGYLYVIYQPYQLQQLEFDEIQNRGFPPEVYKQLEEISKTVKAEDNPVLLIGKLKSNIVLE